MRLAYLLALTLYILHLPAPLNAAGQTDQFLHALIGDWIGRAELTPIGPRDYDIRFAIARVID